jgi:hypothetical protein
MRLAALMFVIACGGSPKAPPASTAPASTPPAGTDTTCPAEGTACQTENDSCGGPACKDAKGFCNVVVCRGGTWQRMEVPPPPP